MGEGIEEARLRREKLEQVVRKFIDDNKITCQEAVSQSDHVILSAYAFIEKLCDIAGYYQYPEDK